MDILLHPRDAQRLLSCRNHGTGSAAKVLAWRLSNTMDASFCVTALEEAIARFGKPRDLQTPIKARSLTSFASPHLEGCRTFRISMDVVAAGWTTSSSSGLWRSLKYECVYLNAFETGSEAEPGSIRFGSAYYNADRPHSTFGGRTPDEVYATQANQEKLAA